MESYYEVLDVTPAADVAQLSRAYRLAARRTHPDTGGTPEAFYAVQAAWNTLSDPQRRARYDARTNPPPGPQTHAATSAGASPPPRAAPPAAEPGSAEPGPTHPADPRDSGTSPTADAHPAPDGTSPRRRRRQAWVQGGLAGTALITGILTWLILDDLGSVVSVAAMAYLILTGAALVSQWAGIGPGERYLRALLCWAWWLAAGLTVLAVISWAQGRSPVPALVWAGCVAAFAASTTALQRMGRAAEAR